MIFDKSDLSQFEYPIGICWVLTAACNLTCDFCYAPKVVDDAAEYQQLKILDRLAQNGISYLSFTGGEALLVKHLPNLIRTAKKLGIFTDLCTNGLLLSKSFMDSVDGYLDQISLPLDGPDNITNLKTRKIENYLNTFQNSVSIIEEAQCSLKINTLLCSYNLNRLSEIQKILDKIPTLNRWKLNRYYHVTSYDEKFLLDLESIKLAIIKQINSDRHYDICFKNHNDEYQSSFVSLSSNGELYLTHNHKRHILGSVLSEQTYCLLNSSKLFNKQGHFEKYRRYIKTKVAYNSLIV